MNYLLNARHERERPDVVRNRGVRCPLNCTVLRKTSISLKFLLRSACPVLSLSWQMIVFKASLMSHMRKLRTEHRQKKRRISHLRQTPLFSQLSLCLPRARLRKTVHFVYKWHRKKWRFAHRSRAPPELVRIALQNLFRRHAPK